MHRVVERILNLLAFLLTAGRPVTAAEIRVTVAGYDQESDEAFRRTFERDKDLLRRLGVPLRLEALDAWEVEHGYVVPSEEYALPDLGLTDEERAALALAAQVVRLGGRAPDSGAMFKLGGAPLAAGGEPLAADLGTPAEDLAALFGAVNERRRVTFTYPGGERTLEPYGLVHRWGHWYAVGMRRDQVRAYRIDRMTALRVGDTPNAFSRSPRFRVAEALPDAPWEAGAEDVTVTVRFEAEVAWWARRQLTARADISEHDDGAVTASFPVANLDSLVGWMIGFEEHAEILAPPEARRRIVDHLRETG